MLKDKYDKGKLWVEHKNGSWMGEMGNLGSRKGQWKLRKWYIYKIKKWFSLIAYGGNLQHK